jgi:hypothetical protein
MVARPGPGESARKNIATPKASAVWSVMLLYGSHPKKEAALLPLREKDAEP